MAVPKKKISRSRRNMRRFAGGNQLEKPTGIVCPITNTVRRPHRITKELLATGRYLEVTAKGKKATASAKA